MGDPEAVTVAYVCGNTVHYSWFRSMFELREYDLQHSQRIQKGGYIAVRHGAGGLVEARNRVVSEFLHHEKDADWLFWIDTDMGFAADTIDRLLEAADSRERPMVGALCFFNREDEPDDMGGWRTVVVPTVYDWVHVDDQFGWRVRWNYTPNSLTQVGGTGAAAVLIHRSVFEKIEKQHGQVWYDRVPNVATGQLVGEDLSFCLRAGALKIPIYVHTGVVTSHAKQIWLSEDHYARQVAVDSIAQVNRALEEGASPESVTVEPFQDPRVKEAVA